MGIVAIKILIIVKKITYIITVGYILNPINSIYVSGITFNKI